MESKTTKELTTNEITAILSSALREVCVPAKTHEHFQYILSLLHKKAVGYDNYENEKSLKVVGES